MSKRFNHLFNLEISKNKALKLFIFLPETTPRIVITENPDAGVFAQKLNKYAIKIAGTPWNKTIKMVAPEISNCCRLLVKCEIFFQDLYF